MKNQTFVLSAGAAIRSEGTRLTFGITAGMKSFCFLVTRRDLVKMKNDTTSREGILEKRLVDMVEVKIKEIKKRG
jgi:hypothetical protein